VNDLLGYTAGVPGADAALTMAAENNEIDLILFYKTDNGGSGGPF
jgi:hypothetical protein